MLGFQTANRAIEVEQTTIHSFLRYYHPRFLPGCTFQELQGPRVQSRKGLPSRERTKKPCSSSTESLSSNFLASDLFAFLASSKSFSSLVTVSDIPSSKEWIQMVLA